MASRVLRQAEQRKKLRKAADANRDPAELDVDNPPAWGGGKPNEPGPQPQDSEPGGDQKAPDPADAEASADQEDASQDDKPKQPAVRTKKQVAPVPPEVPALPSEDAPPAEIITIASRVIYKAIVRYEEGQRRLTDQLFQEAGPAVRLVHATKAFREIQDPATNRTYRSFRKWAADNGISKTHAYRMINEVPVVAALKPFGVKSLPSGHVDVLAPVLRQHGEEVLQRMWEVAKLVAEANREDGRPTVEDLKRARLELGLSVNPEDDEPPAPLDPAKTFKAVQRALNLLANTDALRLAMQHDPHAVRELVRQVFSTTDGLNSNVPAQPEGRSQPLPEPSQVGTVPGGAPGEQKEEGADGAS
ncbi:hypothetical protein [Streptomyces sp. 5-10]|uniref:hypothetical protein n=1 Tax=Streptomyces sp. 5-10 TaxID=878925 RepID=UPI00168A52A2|nr:hypothetical protein [Streptomyces sp. 5-10]MBD3004842.1 hypothetical protein [Streptomyces sp. 5-10]